MSSTKTMEWDSAFNYLQRGHRIKHPEWGGFWWWDELSDTILMFTRRGAILDLRKSEDLRYTLTFMGQPKWVVAEDEDLDETCLAVWKAFEQTPRKDLVVEDIARVCHTVNRAYSEALGELVQPSWDNAPRWMRDSAITGVEMHLKYPDATPEDSHQSWLDAKVADGWKWGEFKDEELKEHPCMKPYSELPVAQQAKDYLFRATVHSVKGVMRYVPKK